ncbi:classical arabinogalactan protein 9-like [Eucalyptus grandis]|uniref:classical arabinogalactan protein 9-like n=1 Tax=Eucalyptus grandis TaxID=71139 RepID=UPI00192EEB84|nr:classical arabinogalactan protein 9-like [Eucalyptus grandis]
MLPGGLAALSPSNPAVAVVDLRPRALEPRAPTTAPPDAEPRSLDDTPLAPARDPPPPPHLARARLQGKPLTPRQSLPLQPSSQICLRRRSQATGDLEPRVSRDPAGVPPPANPRSPTTKARTRLEASLSPVPSLVEDPHPTLLPLLLAATLAPDPVLSLDAAPNSPIQTPELLIAATEASRRPRSAPPAEARDPSAPTQPPRRSPCRPTPPPLRLRPSRPATLPAASPPTRRSGASRNPSR